MPDEIVVAIAIHWLFLASTGQKVAVLFLLESLAFSLSARAGF
jgi:hypothetical protein